MADLSSLVEYDKPHPVKIKTPNGEDTGIVINVVSQDSQRVVKALRESQADAWRSEAVGDGSFADMVKARERTILIHSIDSWDWGEHSFAHINTETPPDLEARTFLIDHPNAGWIRNSLAEGCAVIENFTNPLPKNARRGSKKT